MHKIGLGVTALVQHTFALAFLQFPQALSVTDAGALRFLLEGGPTAPLPLLLAFSGGGLE